MNTSKLFFSDIPDTYFLFRDRTLVLCACPAKPCLAYSQYARKVAHKMMDIPVRLCELCYQVLSVRCLNPVCQFLYLEIFYFLPYDSPDARSSGIIKADADSNICSNGQFLLIDYSG